MTKKIILVILVSVLGLVIPTYSKASEEFDTSVFSTYQYYPDGKSQISHNIEIKNNTSNSYISTYTINLYNKNIQKISLKDQFGDIPYTKESPKESDYKIKINFKTPVVGKNQVRSFQLRYESSDAKHNGKIWEVTIPKFQGQTPLDKYQVSILTPSSWGKTAFSSPKPDEEEYDNNSTKLTYNFAQNGILVSFGEFQSLSFNLRYNLKNDSSKKAKQTITIPADTSMQHIAVDAIIPPPQDVLEDQDGNWIAHYELPPNSSLDISVSGQALIYPNPRPNKKDLSQEEVKAYTQSQKYWEVDDQKIKDISQKFTIPRQIYDYVISALSYDQSRLKSDTNQRKGALSSLATPTQSVCQEFSDLFITIARANGIPARLQLGYAYSADPKTNPTGLIGDLLHAWPQYYDFDTKTWISVDPTWAQTSGLDYFESIDLSRVVFATQGYSSTLPIPPGYQKTNPLTQNIQVFSDEYKTKPDQDLIIKYHKPSFIFPFYSKSYLTIQNPGPFKKTDITLDIEGFNILTKDKKIENFSLPPMGKKTIEFELRSNFFPTAQDKYISFVTNFGKKTYNLELGLFAPTYVAIISISSLSLIFMAYVAHRAWGVYLQRHSK